MVRDPNSQQMLTGLIADAKQIVVFTGAGISTGSGIPDFRGPGGVWTQRRPVYYDDFIASEEARREHWDYKLESWQAFRDADPNQVHKACVEIEVANKLLMLITQNIDGLHQKAGTSRDLLVELHGTNSEIECLSCGKRTVPEPHFDEFTSTRMPPRCSCGGLLKSATISFGQSLKEEDIAAAQTAAASCDLFIALGSSLSVSPAASIPLQAARRDIPYVVVNRGPTDHDDLPEVTLRIEGDVQETFPPAVREALGRGCPKSERIWVEA